MTFSATVLADSINDINDHRLTTFEVTFPRIILAEVNTHRLLSRNSSSSRAVPTRRILEEIRDNPFVPGTFGSYQPGMVSGSPLAGKNGDNARRAWINASHDAIRNAIVMVYGDDSLYDSFMDGGELPVAEKGVSVHKELVNRIIEPYTWQTAIISATQWENFFRLRCAPDAQPQINTLATLMRDAMESSSPTLIKEGQWHLPLVSPQEVSKHGEDSSLLISAGRCARVSYLTQGLQRPVEKDLSLSAMLVNNGHMSPFEHQATPDNDADANFRGWRQLRYTLERDDSRR